MEKGLFLLINLVAGLFHGDFFLFKIWTNFQLSVDGQQESLEEKLQLSADYMYRVVLGVLTLAG